MDQTVGVKVCSLHQLVQLGLVLVEQRGYHLTSMYNGYSEACRGGGEKRETVSPQSDLGGDCLPPKFPDNLLRKCILEIHTYSLNIYGLNYYKKR